MNYLDTHCVLKLNKLWQPIRIVTGVDAITDLYKGSVRAIDIEYDQTDLPLNIAPLTWPQWQHLACRKYDYVIRTISCGIRMPTVVVCEYYNKMPIKKKKLSKRTVYERDRGTCQYTGKKLSSKTASIDHVVPVSRGGTNTWENVVLAHIDVNYKKSNKTLEEAGLKLLRKPFEPRPVPVSVNITNEYKIKDWNVFLDMYSNK